MEIRLRGFAQRTSEGKWYVHCIDLTLDAVADTYTEARAKLDNAIMLYIEWALESGRPIGQLRRPSPLHFRIRYWRAWLASKRDALVRTALQRTVPAGDPESEFVTAPRVLNAVPPLFAA